MIEFCQYYMMIMGLVARILQRNESRKKAKREKALTIVPNNAVIH